MIGRKNIRNLSNRRVAVFGIGGVGGHAVESLCRCGIGMIDIFDGDIIDITNINRQIIATHKTIGREKTDVMRERLLEINPNLIIKARKLFYLPENAGEIDLSVYDYVIDAVDTMSAKIELICRCIALCVPVISSMGAANKLDPAAFEVADIYSTSVCPMARIMRNELRKRGVKSLKVVYSKEKPLKPVDLPADDLPTNASLTNNLSINASPSCNSSTFNSQSRPLPASISFVPPVVGLIMAGEVVKDLLHQLQR